MKKMYLLTLMAALTVQGFAQHSYAMPATDTVRQQLDNDPELAAARAQLEASGYAAESTAASPYEWTVELAGQRRSYDTGGANSNEWSAGIQRGVRWPNKMILDHKLGDAAQQEAQLRYDLAREQAAQDFLTLWLDWSQAKTREALLQKQHVLAAESVSIVGKRLSAGDAAAQDATLANAELSGLASQLAAAALETQHTESTLRNRFPDLSLSDSTLPEPKPPEGERENWKKLILAVNPNLALAHLRVQQATLTAERAGAEKLPDPTLGVFTASEAQSTEKIVGVSISMPLPGARRFHESSRARAEASAAELTSHSEIRRAESQALQDWQSAMSGVEVWRLAEQSAQAQSESALRSQKAYGLGEIQLQELLLIRRQAISIADTALTARVSALRAAYTLEIHAHQGWLTDTQAPKTIEPN